jgi:hypothetical protein
MTEQVVKDTERVLDRRLTAVDNGLMQAAENIAVFAQENGGLGSPRVVEYTSLAGSFGRLCAQNARTALGPTDVATRDWLSLGEEDKKLKNNLIVFEGNGFFQFDAGWRTVLLRDCLWYLKDVAALTQFLTDLAVTLTVETDVVFCLDKPSAETKTEELSGVLITRKTETPKARTIRRTTVVRTPDENHSLTEELTSWTVSEVFSCAREVGYAPAKGFLNLDPTRFTIYRLRG